MILYDAFGWRPPQYAHVGLLQDSNHQKYSKRSGASHSEIRSLERQGVFAEALINFVALHGWSHDLRDDFLRLQDLVDHVCSLSRDYFRVMLTNTVRP